MFAGILRGCRESHRATQNTSNKRVVCIPLENHLQQSARTVINLLGVFTRGSAVSSLPSLLGDRPRRLPSFQERGCLRGSPVWRR